MVFTIYTLWLSNTLYGLPLTNVLSVWEVMLAFHKFGKFRGRIKGTIKHEAIKLLKGHTCLSCREIGVLLNVNKSTVHELN